ncbi:MAG: phosphocholine-specific phospholipase C [Fimbriimonas sp.]
METRREFLRKAAVLSGTAFVWGSIPEAIARAVAIDPEAGSTYLDAEHVVILMQENRSFDHSYGALQGVRGYNDPRAHVLPNGNPVWLQTDGAGDTFAPFRLDIKGTNATWMGSLPHGWDDQVMARNEGKYDRWLPQKAHWHPPYAKMPLTLGHYTREDIPFYYALADAFTVCDYHFCSSLTGTTPNRLFLWSGTNRDANGWIRVHNHEADHDCEIPWTAFPDRLEDLGISWKIYQNELYLDTGFKGEEDGWLGNFGDNPIEYFTHYKVRFSESYRKNLEKRAKELPAELAAAEAKGEQKAIDAKRAEVKRNESERAKWNAENWERLSAREKSLHRKAFCVNSGDPDWRQLETLTYRDGDEERKVQVPKGDIFHQFREDVRTGNLPTVSWLVAPENFSDHPTSAWYGAWYVSEALDILTQNPEVWKKTIFILTYDENDGYFDHVPPFVAPDPSRPETGKVTDGIDTAPDFVTSEQEAKWRPKGRPHVSSVGLGYRVPMVVASPWSRGGCVNSEVFDHTSSLQFLEHFLSHKTGKRVTEPNIGTWRRTICGDLTSIFRPYDGERIDFPKPLARDEFVESIHRARFKKPPTDFKALKPDEIERVKRDPSTLSNQEKGTRRSCPLPYELYADGKVANGKLKVEFEARKDVFGAKAVGSPFNVYEYGDGDLKARSYAVEAGKSVSDAWDAAGPYHVRVDGPNGFMREFRGKPDDGALDVEIVYAGGKRPSGNVEVRLTNRSGRTLAVEVVDHAYGAAPQRKSVPAGGKVAVTVDTKRSGGWYDFSVQMAGGFERRAAGRVETGRWSTTDPAMG